MNNHPMSHLLVAGNPFFLSRHRQLTAALSKHIPRVEELEILQSTAGKATSLLRDGLCGRIRMPLRHSLKSRLQAFAKRPSTFRNLSSATAARILAATPRPDFVLQLFSMSSPAGATGIPYAHYIDITMAMAKRGWPAWAPFESSSQLEKWLELEGASYRKAKCVFTFSEATRKSVITDYAVSADRVVAVGAAGHYDAARHHKRKYGSRTIIFNGSDFERKGGARALAAFAMVRQHFPDASLTIVANRELPAAPGVRLAGRVTRDHLFSLFETSDVVLAPTHLDVLPGFVLEAMSCGVVPVLSDAESMDEVISSGTEGYIVSPTSPERLADRICELFKDNRALARMGSAARSRVEKSWNWDSVAHTMISALV
jgi:glycogen synthase